VAINLPHELAWVLQMLDFEWPEIDEDEVQRGAAMLRQYGEDISAAVERADQIVHSQIAPAYKAQGGDAFVKSWDETRSSNIQGFVQLIDPAATGMDVFADVVVGLKLKVIAELVLTAAQIATAIAAAAFTFGASLAAQTAIFLARKQALKFATNVIIEQAMIQIFEMIEEPLMGAGTQLISMIAEAEVVQGVVSEVEGVKIDLAALETASGDLQTNAHEQQTITGDFIAQFQSLQMSTAE